MTARKDFKVYDRNGLVKSGLTEQEAIELSNELYRNGIKGVVILDEKMLR